jgi:DtxR family transcriptional regulator, Mn-dependent transcriptional regulator
MQTFCGLTTDGMLEYLAMVYKLGRNNGRVTTSALAERMHVSAAAASSMLKRLEDSGFVDRSSEGIKLTEQGRLAAMQLIRRHRLLEVFLIEVMEYTWDQVDDEAHRLQHAISANFEERMDRLCNYPTHCPHGDPIPRKDGTMPDEPIVPVLELDRHQVGILRRVDSSDARVLRYLGQLRLMPGRKLRLVEVAPFNGPVTLEAVEDDEVTTWTQILGRELADKLFVFALSQGSPIHSHEQNHSV